MSSDSTLSSVLPAITECTPQELLPIMPPRVQRSCVAGSGPKVRRCFSAALRGERCATAAGQHRRPMLATSRDCGQNIRVIARDHDADGNLAVTRAVGGIECAAARVEADLAADSSTQ